MRKKAAIPRLGHAFEIEQYVHALGTSSTHVRFVMLAIIIAIIASATTLWSSNKESWEKARIKKFYDEFTKAAANDLWHSAYLYDPGTCPKAPQEEDPTLLYKLISLSWTGEPISKTKNLGFVKRNLASMVDRVLSPKQREDLIREQEKRLNPEQVESYRNLNSTQACAVLSYFKGRGVTNKEEAQEYGEKLYEAYVNNMLYIHVPVLGTILDVNDLGLITGVTFFTLMLVMSFYTHRAHENLAVCMWKVSEIAEKEQCFDVPGGKPNLLYHALAMQQVFTIPPTLARWRDNWIFRRSHYLLFLLPFITELMVTLYDLRTANIGSDYSTSQTRLSLQTQLLLLGVALFLCMICLSHLYADDVLWKRTFLHINPAHRFKDKTRWIYWTHLAENITPGWGLIARDGAIFLSDTVRESIWKVTKDRIVYHEGCFAKGLYLKENEVKQYSPKANNLTRFRRRIWWFQTWKKPLSWENRPPAQNHSTPESIIGLFGTDDRLQVRERDLERSSGTNSSIWTLGGAEQQVDGPGSEAGFLDIRAIISADQCLFITDGALLRKIEERGTVETWGGRPLAQAVRRDPPFLLGIHVIVNGQVEPEREFEIGNEFKPGLLVCDFSTRRVFAVTKDAAAEAYKSKWGWTPAGVFADDEYIYLLEYRRGFIWNELVTFWQTVNHPLGHLFRGRNYARVIGFSSGSFSSRPQVLFQMSPRTARRAKNEHQRALRKKRGPQGIRNHDWRSGLSSRMMARLGLLPSYQFLQLYLKARG